MLGLGLGMTRDVEDQIISHNPKPYSIQLEGDMELVLVMFMGHLFCWLVLVRVRANILRC